MRNILIITLALLLLVFGCAANHALNKSKELTSEQKTTLKQLEKMGATKAELDMLSILIVTKAPQNEIQKRIDPIIQKRLSQFTPEQQRVYYSLTEQERLEYLASKPGEWIKNRDKRLANEFCSTRKGKIQYYLLETMVSKDSLTNFIRQDSIGKVEWLKKFWANNDPTPTTEENEFKKEVDRRVEYALTNFRTSWGKKLWDARGEIYIRLGDPYERRLAVEIPWKVKFEEDGETWTYHLDDGREVIFQFEDIHLIGEFSLVPHRYGDIRDLGYQSRFGIELSKLGQTAAVYHHDYGGKALKFAWEVLKFRHKKNIYEILVNIGLPTEKLQRDSSGSINLRLRIAVRDENGDIIAQDSVKVRQKITDAKNQLLIDQKRFFLPSGTYDVALETRDLISKRIGLYQERIYLPTYTDADSLTQPALALSRAILSSRIEEAQPGYENNKFYLNGLLVFPNPAHTFFKDQEPEINAYFEIYNLTTRQDTANFATVSWIIYYESSSDSALVSCDTISTTIPGFVPGAIAYRLLPLINNSSRTLEPGTYIWRIDVTDLNARKGETILNWLKIQG